MEKVNFKIDLDIVTHDDVKEHPFVNISVNGHPKYGEFLNKSTLVEIDVDLEDNSDNVLTIEYLNKDPVNDVIFDQSVILKDKRVEVKKISINDIELGYHNFDNNDTFIYESLDGKVIHKGFEACKLSWNGRTSLKFSTPIYIWILENI
tara:strand:- start:355 stop:801 length:447 start_codon:yes stop_codon:yes gene_type:complete